MRVWRISSLLYPDRLSGAGGLYSAGRWHLLGHRIIYTAISPSLAALEMLIYFDPIHAPSGLGLAEIDIPDELDIEVCNPVHLTKDWKVFPFPIALQNFGTTWLEEKRTAILQVPSAQIPKENNYLLNPNHVDFPRIHLVNEEPFSYDDRFFK
jgi:RES domain-containing protein